MDRFSNTILGSLNFFLLSIPILSSGIWLGFNALTQCEVFFYKPMIALGAFLMIIAIIGLIGSCCKVTWILWFYVVVMFLLIICVLCFTFFAFVVTRVGSGEAIPGKAYKEYRLEDYFGWMQDRVNYVKHWDNIRSCLRKNGHICNSLELFSANETFYAFYKHDLTALESGCCKPSNDCNFIYINATTWTKDYNRECRFWRVWISSVELRLNKSGCFRSRLEILVFEES
ncbi:unnamed protein product [Cochlearia groenlandica]